MEQLPPEKPTASFSDIVINVLTSPQDAFEGIKGTASRVGLWFIPLLLLIILAGVSFSVMMTNETLKEQFMEAQKQAVQASVESGRMTQAQADQQAEGMAQMGGIFLAIGLVGIVITLSLIFFGAALFLWLMGKFVLKAPDGYSKYLELYGLSTWIGVLGIIVNVLMMIGLNTIYASPSAALAVYANYNPLDLTHRLLSTLNIFSIWQMVIVGIGLAKLSNKSITFGVAASCILWLLWVAGSQALGFAR
ncbi:MAG: YIP1 family protein [bacterium]